MKLVLCQALGPDFGVRRPCAALVCRDISIELVMATAFILFPAQIQSGAGSPQSNPPSADKSSYGGQEIAAQSYKMPKKNMSFKNAFYSLS